MILCNLIGPSDITENEVKPIRNVALNGISLKACTLPYTPHKPSGCQMIITQFLEKNPITMATLLYIYIIIHIFNDIFNDFYTCNRNIHGRETRQASDLHVPYGRLDIRQNSMKIHGANMWNSIPENVKMSESVYLFKQRLRNFLLDWNNSI